MSYDLVAITPQQMEASHDKLVAWADAGIEDAKTKAEEAKTNYELAVQRKWKASYLRRVWKQQEKRAEFFAKAREALKAGFYIIPDMWMNTFAVRIPENAKLPADIESSRWRSSVGDHPVEPRRLPAGAGKYVGDKCEFYTWEEPAEDNDGKKYTKHNSSASRFSDLTFPMAMAKPAIMDRTQEALALKVFDEIGIIQQKKDPIIAGRIRHPKGNDLLFFIAWDFDPTGF